MTKRGSRKSTKKADYEKDHGPPTRAAHAFFNEKVNFMFKQLHYDLRHQITLKGLLENLAFYLQPL